MLEEYNVEVYNKKCSKCWGTLYANMSISLTTLPEQYSAKCEKCNHIENVTMSDIVWNGRLETLPVIQEGCNHVFDIKLIDGQLVTFCTKCGRIGDTQYKKFDYDISNCTTESNE